MDGYKRKLHSRGALGLTSTQRSLQTKPRHQGAE